MHTEEVNEGYYNRKYDESGGNCGRGGIKPMRTKSHVLA